MTKIPKLPYGEGSMSLLKDGNIFYKKNVVLPDGSKKRHAVRGKTPQECLQKMREYESTLAKATPENKEVLIDKLTTWANDVKKPTLKSQSYRRLESTIRVNIGPSDIGHLRYQSVTTEEIQEYLNSLVGQYAKTSIKKIYDCLNDFYRHYSTRYKFDNPMLLVKMPRIEENMAEQKEIVFFCDEDIEKFIKESKALWNTGTPKYQGGPMLAANIFLGMRMGELLALQWKDIDFEHRTIFVCKTLIEEANPDYNPNDPESKKVRFRVQNSNKTSHNRYVPINDKALELIREHRKNCKYLNSEDYVISTRNRKTTTIKNVSDTIKRICENGELSVIASNSHILRHSAASLYFRSNVPVEIVAKILGHSVEVCRSTYIHFIDDQLQAAAKLIDVINV